MMRIVLSSGEPAGIGPDLCVAAAQREWPCELVVIASAALLRERARQMGTTIRLQPYSADTPPGEHTPGTLLIEELPLAAPVRAGQLDPANAHYVLDMITRATDGCLSGEFAGMVTSPVHKGVINDAGQPFTGHTEFIADRCGTGMPVMLLAAGDLRVALATTHLPLREVSDAITAERLSAVLEVLDKDLRERFGIATPRILVCGLNPHAGEGGHLGREEIDIITPTLEALRSRGLNLIGPLPADTAFTGRHLANADAVLAMFHDQGLPVLKYAGFGQAINVTLGLPIVRVSVDHGTALDLAGSGAADPGSLYAAIELAARLAATGAR